MRKKIIMVLKNHPIIVKCFWKIARFVLYLWGIFVPVRENTMLFCSFGGRKFDDSPKAIYEELCKRIEFDDWQFIWAFINPSEFEIPRGKKIKIDTFSFFYALLYSRVWVSNSGMDRGIELHRKKNIIVETWHGTPIKKIGGEENQNSLGGGIIAPKGKPDRNTIRCAQSEFDRQIFSRIFNAEKDAILLSDLPRNDELLRYNDERIQKIKKNLRLDVNKKIILYTPTYREYLVEKGDTFLAPPIDLKKWEKKLGNEYILLIRAHYAVSKSLNITDNQFVKDVSNYHSLNDLYIISDMMISDYSSTFIDYSILNRPMFCFAYDLEEYSAKRGLYFDLAETLPCSIDKTEDVLLNHICNVDYAIASKKTKDFCHKFAPYAGKACEKVVNEIIKKINYKNE